MQTSIPIPAFHVGNPVRDEILAACRAQRDQAPELFDPLIAAITSDALQLTLATETWDLATFGVTLIQTAALNHHFGERLRDAVSAGAATEGWFLAWGMFRLIADALYRAGAERWGKTLLS